MFMGVGEVVDENFDHPSYDNFVVVFWILGYYFDAGFEGRHDGWDVVFGCDHPPPRFLPCLSTCSAPPLFWSYSLLWTL